MNVGGHSSGNGAVDGAGNGVEPTTVFVVADVLLYREGLREILGRHPELSLIHI